MSQKEIRWFPLESNPAVMNRYAASLGVDTSKVSFHDVFGLDEDLLGMLPQPVLAMLLVFPVSDATDAEAKRQIAAQQAEHSAIVADSNVLFMKQTIGNACGTVGILHALLNADPTVVRPSFTPGSFIAKFASAVGPLNPLERARLMEQSPELHSAHAVAASEGRTFTGDAEDDIDLHFVCFCALPVSGCDQRVLLEFDGRQEAPIIRGGGPASLETMCAEAIRQRMAANPESLRFTITAMCASAAPE
jgi:ubiquitin carboxyl-terminal hydrolase L3